MTSEERVVRAAVGRVVLLATLVLVAGCTGGNSPRSDASTPDTAPVSPASTSGAASGSPVPSVTSPSASGPAQVPKSTAPGEETPTGQPAPQPLAGAAQGTPSVAARPGALPVQERASSRPGTFEAPATFTDGTSVSVGSVSNTVSSAKGPGTVTGQSVTRMTLRIDNGSGAPLDLNNVVVTVTYGAEQTHAAPVYDEQVQDFAGKLGPARAATATYAFAVPVEQRHALRVYVDVDGRHLPAVLTGSA